MRILATIWCRFLREDRSERLQQEHRILGIWGFLSRSHHPESFPGGSEYFGSGSCWVFETGIAASSWWRQSPQEPSTLCTACHPRCREFSAEASSLPPFMQYKTISRNHCTPRRTLKPFILSAFLMCRWTLWPAPPLSSHPRHPKQNLSPLSFSMKLKGKFLASCWGSNPRLLQPAASVEGPQAPFQLKIGRGAITPVSPEITNFSLGRTNNNL